VGVALGTPAHGPVRGSGTLKLESSQSGLTFGRVDLLRWIYAGRVAVVSGVFVGALYRWLVADPQQTFLATVMFVLALGASGLSFWHTHGRSREAGRAFLYAQVVLDVILATGVVHITGGADSNFAPLYVLVIGEGALLLPLPGGVLIGALACLLYVADILLFHAQDLSGAVAYQIGLFGLIAFVTGYLGDRVRRAGLAAGTAESELRQLRLDTSEILTQIATGVLTVDGRGRLAYVNPAGEAMLGLDGRRLLGAPVMGIVDKVAPGMGLVLRRALERGISTARFRTVTMRGNENLVLGVSTAVLQRADGGPPSATAIFQDITELERVAALNRRAERLEAIAELSASLAHEIKNPLASIRSAVEQLTHAPLDGDDRATLERLVIRESDRLSRLLSEFLEFSSLRMGRSETVDLAALVRESVDVVQQHPEATEGIEIVCRGLDEALPVAGDADLLHRAVFNLLLNAVQFSAPDGTVTVEVERSASTPEGVDLPDAVRLTVLDTGPGVSEEDQRRIFDPFFTTRSGGSGLGLAVVHRAVEVHEGAVLVGAAPGGGGEFTIYLPGTGAAPVAASREAT
jgi:two-component system sensor histidine kinase PilS (NtrC family)